MSVKILENLIDNNKEFTFADLTSYKFKELSEKYINNEDYENNQIYFALDDDDLIYAVLYDTDGSDDFACENFAMTEWGCTSTLYYNPKSSNCGWSYL